MAMIFSAIKGLSSSFRKTYMSDLSYLPLDVFGSPGTNRLWNEDGSVF